MRFLRLSVVSGLAAMVVVAIGPSTVGAQGLAVTCGSIITEDTVLTRNLNDCADGLVVAGTGVALDLRGYTISGRTGADGTGITVTGQNVTIKNGKITGFGRGIAAFALYEPQPTFHLQSLKVVGNRVGVNVSRGGGPDFLNESSVESSQIDGNTGYGVEFDHVALAVTNSSIRRNGSSGVHQVEAIALYARNDVSQNGGDGISASNPYTFTGGLYGNTLNGNGGSGYSLSQQYPDPYPHLEHNRADRNGQLGFLLFGNGGSVANLDGGDNSAKLNGDSRQCVVQDAVNAIAPDALVCHK